jgi:hypothetical protein
VIGVLARLPLARIARSPRQWLTTGAWSALAVGFAIAARADSWAHGADHVLVSVYGSLSLPFMAYALAREALGARSMVAATSPLVAFGATPWRAALACSCVAAAAAALSGACIAAVVALVAHGSADPPQARDALLSAYVGGLGGAAYAAWFTVGSAIGRRGGGRLLLLAVDWLLGEAGGPLALATPRAHLRNLLGGVPPSSVSERTSALALVALAVLYALIAARGAQRRS